MTLKTRDFERNVPITLTSSVTNSLLASFAQLHLMSNSSWMVVTIEQIGLPTIHSNFGSGWESAMPDSWPNKGDTLIGSDVWIGYGRQSCLVFRLVMVQSLPQSQSLQRFESYCCWRQSSSRNPQAFWRIYYSELVLIQWWNWDIEKLPVTLKLSVARHKCPAWRALTKRCAELWRVICSCM